MKVPPREEKILEAMCVALAKHNGEDPYEEMLRVDTVDLRVERAKLWQKYRPAAMKFRTAALAMQVAEFDHPEPAPTEEEAAQALENEMDLAIIKLVIGDAEERAWALTTMHRLGTYPYLINNDMNEPKLGLPMTCACGRLNEELTPDTRFTALHLGGRVASYRLYCDRCIGLCDFVGIGFDHMAKRHGGIELLKLCLKRGAMGDAGGVPQPEAAKEPTPEPAQPQLVCCACQATPVVAMAPPLCAECCAKEQAAGRPPASSMLLAHEPAWKMFGGRELCAVCGYWRYSAEAENAHRVESPEAPEEQGGSIPAKTAEIQAQNQDA